MSLIDTLKEVEADITALGGLSGEIRSKVKDGVAELTRIRDDIAAALAAVTGSARKTLASVQALAADGVVAAAVPVPTGDGPAAEQDGAKAGVATP